MYAHARVPDVLNLQEKSGKAKGYQVRQFLQDVELFKLTMEEER
jgi:hypothetical protein